MERFGKKEKEQEFPWGERERGREDLLLQKARKSVRKWWDPWIDVKIRSGVRLQHLITTALPLGRA